jgi:hypothetical protein
MKCLQENSVAELKIIRSSLQCLGKRRDDLPSVNCSRRSGYVSVYGMYGDRGRPVIDRDDLLSIAPGLGAPYSMGHDLRLQSANNLFGRERLLSGGISYMLVRSRFCKVSPGSTTLMRSFARIGMRSEGGACCSLLIYDHRTVFRVSIMKESGWDGGGNVPFAKADVEGNSELKLERRKLGEQQRQDFAP